MTEPVAIVTGAASGLGKATAERLAEGHQLVIADIAEQQLNEFALMLRQKGVNVYPLICDVSKRQDIENVVNTAVKAGQITAAFHAAGVAQDQADSEKVYSVNLLGTAYLLDALTPHVKNGAAVICVASQASYFADMTASPEIKRVLENPLAVDFFERLHQFDATENPYKGSNAYGLSKLGVRLLVEKTAIPWGKVNARVASISPGMIATPMAFFEATRQPGMKVLLDHTPLGRYGQPSEIANVARFLCSPEASFVSGVDVLVDGGATHRVVKGLLTGEFKITAQ